MSQEARAPQSEDGGAEVLHIWNMARRSICDRAQLIDGADVQLRPPRRASRVPMCAACVMGVEILVAAVRGTEAVASGYDTDAQGAIDALRTSAWAGVVDLDSLSLQANDHDRGLAVFTERGIA